MVLFWSVAARQAIRRWEIAFARQMLTGSKTETWKVQLERHYAAVALRNLLRGLEKVDDVLIPVDPDFATDITNLRDLVEHWDENMPVFNVWPQGTPNYPSGRSFANRHPGKRPYGIGHWNNSTGPTIGPGLPVASLYSWLDEVDAAALAERPELADYVPELPASPWVGGDGADRWFPHLDADQGN